MVRIRLRRTGMKKQSSYRLVIADKESPRDGRFLEIVGSYNPRTHPSTLEVKEDRIYHWLSNGAQPSESVVKLFNSIGLTDRFERFKGGEAVEKLLAEAKGVMEKRITDVKAAAGKKPAGKPAPETPGAPVKEVLEAKPAQEPAVEKEVKAPKPEKKEKPAVAEVAETTEVAEASVVAEATEVAADATEATTQPDSAATAEEATPEPVKVKQPTKSKAGKDDESAADKTG